MKRVLVLLIAVALLGGTCWAAEKAMPKGKEVTMTGTISCTFCNLPAQANCSKECCTACVKAGDPVLFADAKGKLYVLVSGDKEKPLMTPDRMEMISGKVKVTGIVVKRGGIQGIYVKDMQKAK